MCLYLDRGQRRARAGGRWSAHLFVAALLALSACGDDPTTVVDSDGPTASASPSTGPTTPVGAPSDPAASPSATPSDDYRSVEFRSPTGNIGCSMLSGPDGDSVRCDIGDKAWEAPPKPADCQLSGWGNSLYVGEEESGFACVSDAFDPGAPLPYGEAKALGRVKCTSLETGVRCRHIDSGHGFELSRARYSLF